MYYDVSGREYAKKPFDVFTPIYIHHGWLDTLIDEDLYKFKPAIILQIDREAGTLLPMYDVVYFDKDGLNNRYENRVQHRLCSRIRKNAKIINTDSFKELISGIRKQHGR